MQARANNATYEVREQVARAFREERSGAAGGAAALHEARTGTGASMFADARAFAARVALLRGVLGFLLARGALVQKRRQRFCNKNAYEYQHKACYQARRQNVNAQQHANEGCKNRL